MGCDGDIVEEFSKFARCIGKALAEREAIGAVDKLSRSRNLKEFREALNQIVREYWTYLNKRGMKACDGFEYRVKCVLEGMDDGKLKEGMAYLLGSFLLAQMLAHIGEGSSGNGGGR